MEKLFQKEGLVHPSDLYTHLHFTCKLETVFPYLYVMYKYDTSSPTVDMPALMDEALSKYLDPFERDHARFLYDNPPASFPLITLSLDLNGKYIGASHRRRSASVYFLSEVASSAGFLRIKPSTGTLRLTLSCHQVLADTPFTLEVWGSDTPPTATDAAWQDLIIPADTEKATLPPPIKAKMISTELHTHTRHSDGQFTFKELNENLQAIGIEGFAMTDHNTQSPYDGYDFTGRPVIRGMEWTTFWGHLLVLGGEPVDWRVHTPETFSEQLVKLKEDGKAIGIAHPYSLGNPWCTGCFWETPITDWSLIDYLEVWSLPDPETHRHNTKAWRLWNDVLNQGYRIAAVAGRDWHGPDNDIPCTTELILPDDEAATEKTMVEAIKAGRCGATQGPRLQVQLDGKDPGAEVPAGTKRLEWSVDLKHRAAYWHNLQPTHLVVTHNGIPIATQAMAENGARLSLELKDLEPGWLRTELYGYKHGKAGILLAFMSPFWIV